MYLAYFDENKFSEERPFFYIGGIILDSKKIKDYEKTLTQIQYNFFGTSILNKDTEIHGKDVFHGKGNMKKRSIHDRIELFHDVTRFLIKNKIAIRFVEIDVNSHRDKYCYPEPEYRLGLQLILERFCDFLDTKEALGLVFCDYEKDEVARSILDFSQFKQNNKTPMAFGRPLGRIIDTIYFTQSHHSRFLQVADMVCYLAQRFERVDNKSDKWREKQFESLWSSLKDNSDIKIQKWK